MSLRVRISKVRQAFHAMLKEHLSPRSVGIGVFMGFFIGVLPIYGVHLGVCVVAARAFKLNQALVYGVANVSNPLFAPVLIAAEIKLGAWLRGVEGGVMPEGAFWDVLKQAPSLFWSCTLGSLVLGLVGGAILGVVSALFTAWYKPESQP